MPSNLIIAAVTAFRTLVNTLQGTEDQGQQLRQTVTSLGEVANVLDRLAASTAANEQQFNQLDQRLNQMSATDQQTVQQVQDLQQRVQSAQTTADEAKADVQSTRVNQPAPSMARKPLCESRSVANLKTLVPGRRNSRIGTKN